MHFLYPQMNWRSHRNNLSHSSLYRATGTLEGMAAAVTRSMARSGRSNRRSGERRDTVDTGETRDEM